MLAQISITHLKVTCYNKIYRNNFIKGRIFMKFIHLSDLHIGKKLNEISLLEDQKYILQQITEIVREQQPDGVLLAGDIYDKAIPSVDAVQILDKFLTALATMKVPVFMISGNHDSAERLSFGARLLSSSGIYLSQAYDGTVQNISLQDQYGELNIYLLPFVKPSAVKRFFDEETINDFNDALKTVISHLDIDTSKRNILLAHQFVTGAFRSDSEEIFVGGLDNVDASVFEPFDYTALGHIHGPQNIGSEKIRYCGTPLKYSFSEVSQKKSLTVIELKEKGNLTVSCIPLQPLHDLEKLKGTYMELTDLKFYQNINRENYFHITLTDENDVLDAMQKLRTIYPNLLQLEYDNKRTQSSNNITGCLDVQQKSELELFAEFYQLQNNQPMNDRQKNFTAQLLESLKQN